MDAKGAIILTGAAGLSVFGWYQVRMSIRREVERVLSEDYRYDAYLNSQPVIQKFAADIVNAPTSKELAVSVVPIWSVVGPQQAIEDIMLNGRKSPYWPDNRRETKLPAFADNLIFAYLRRQYYASQAQKALKAV
jgi:hypothetical protein